MSFNPDLSCPWSLRASPLSHLFKVSFTQANCVFSFSALTAADQLFVVCPGIVLTLFQVEYAKHSPGTNVWSRVLSCSRMGSRLPPPSRQS